MKAIGLKNNFHTLIDSINNEMILSKFYSLMKRAKESKQGQLWNALSAKEQEELLKADLESMDDIQLISGKEMKEKHAKWL